MIGAGCTLAQARQALPLDALENRILLCHALRLPRVALITQSERVLSADEIALVTALVQRRLDGEPIAYITGEREFFGLSFKVTPAVLIPRPDTELIVELALARLAPQARVLDMGTGSGAIAVALASNRPDLDVTALDVSEAALAVARENAAANDVRVRFVRSDWYAALAAERFDLIASNPPYIVAGDRHLAEGDLRFEPIDALTDHGDGLAALRTIIDGAPERLVDGGWLLLEHGYDQAAAVRALLQTRGFGEVQSWRDLGNIQRVSGGCFGNGSGS